MVSDEQARLDNYYAKVKAEGTFEPDQQFLDSVKRIEEKLDMNKPFKEIDLAPVAVCCPHCEKQLPLARNMRFMSSQELREYADALDAAQALKSSPVDSETLDCIAKVKEGLEYQR